MSEEGSKYFESMVAADCNKNLFTKHHKTIAHIKSYLANIVYTKLSRDQAKQNSTIMC